MLACRVVWCLTSEPCSLYLNAFAQLFEGLAAWHSMHQSYLAGYMFLLFTSSCLSTSVIGGSPSSKGLPHRVLQAAGAFKNTSSAVPTCSARTTLPPGSDICAYVRANCSEGGCTSVPGLLYCEYQCRLTCLQQQVLCRLLCLLVRGDAQTRSSHTSASSTVLFSELGPLPSLLFWYAHFAGCLLWQ